MSNTDPYDAAGRDILPPPPYADEPRDPLDERDPRPLPDVTLTRDDYERLVEMADNAQDGTSDSTPYEKDAARAYVILRRAERRSR